MFHQTKFAYMPPIHLAIVEEPLNTRLELIEFTHECNCLSPQSEQCLWQAKMAMLSWKDQKDAELGVVIY